MRFKCLNRIFNAKEFNIQEIQGMKGNKILKTILYSFIIWVVTKSVAL